MYYLSSENKGADHFVVTAKLICVFVFSYADCWFSHEVAHIVNICIITRNLNFAYCKFQNVHENLIFANIR